MIGLGFLAVGVLWLALSWYLATRLPRWSGVVKPVWRWLLGTVLFLVLLVGPFVDHIVGMRQFERLCAEETGLHIFPNASNTKNGIDHSTTAEPIDGYLIPIMRRTDSLLDMDTGEVVARYLHFSTQGGRVGGAFRLGSLHECAVFQSNHPDHAKYRSLRKRIEITYGVRK